MLPRIVTPLPAFAPFAIALAAVACAAGGWEPRSAAGGLVAELGGVDPASRSFEARTSVPVRHAPCITPDDLCLPVRCPAASPPDAATLRVAARAAAVLRDSLSADALHASALVDLYWGAPRGNSLGRSLQSLRQAARYERSASAWADLAAAELLAADRNDEPRGRLSALDAAARAVGADSTSVVGRFDFALAAERLGLDGRAREEWMRYLALDDDEEWHRDARAHVAAIDRRAIPSSIDPLDAARLHLLATRDPAAFRTRTLTDQLEAWSRAVAEGRSDSAIAATHVLRVAGAELAAAHGDSTLLDVAAELSTTPLPSGAFRSAAAFAAAQRAAEGGRYAEAESLFARAAAGPLPTIAAWSRVYEAIQQVYTGQAPRAIAVLGAAMSDARAHGRPALEARAGWTLAVLVLRAGRRTEASEIMDRVAQVSGEVGDEETVAALRVMRGEDRYAAGDERAAWRHVMDAMSTLRSHRASLRLRSALNLMAWTADDHGLGNAAAVIRDEEAAVALASGHREFHAEALLAAARSRLRQGDTARALATLHTVEGSVAQLPASDVSRWLFAQAAELRAAAGVPVDRATLDSAVVYFGAQRSGVLLVDALVTRAQALSATEPGVAERDLDSALTLLKARAAQYRSAAERRALERRIRDVAGRSALTFLARRDERQALAAIERGRLGVVPAHVGDAAGDAWIDYLLVGDTLVAWSSAAGGPIATTRDVVPARALAAARDRLVQSAEVGVMDRAASGALYDMLLRRHRAALRDASRLVIVADDDLAGIPFAALYDAADGAYLVERASVRVVPRLADAPAVPARATTAPALFVSDPAFDRAAFPGLPALPGARSEVDSSRRFYRSSIVLAGAAATTSAVSASMPKAGLLHFASHARFDAERPEQSRLVLAPDDRTRDGLSAQAISGMRLGSVRLVVLSSCESTRSGLADAPLTIGLAKAFHDAGVPAVVGALWQVDDDATAALMTELHRRYSRTRNAAEALRDAQLAMLHDARPERRDPAAWGAFVLTGR